MLRKFLSDKRGNYALATVGAIVPLMGALALGVDYSEMSRQKQATINALDAAAVATARRVVEGATDPQLHEYAEDFFDANLNNVNSDLTKLTLVLPKDNVGGGTLKLTADLQYEPVFLGAFEALAGLDTEETDFSATTEVKLKNTVEVALVLDNSGSMDIKGSGSGKKRIDLLKEAAKQLVDTLSSQAGQMKQLSKPVQFGLVPFAGSVNVGSDKASASWMDKDGRSPIHHENFDWTPLGTYTQEVNGVRYARGNEWGDLKDKPLTRFTVFKSIQHVSGQSCVKRKKNGTCETYEDVYASPFEWGGCVESRPYPHNVTDSAAVTATPVSLFVPMFAPDEVGNRWTTQRINDRTVVKTFDVYNNWWDDGTTSTSTDTRDQLNRQKNVTKYFLTRAPSNVSMSGPNKGPNDGCTTKPILPLTDVSSTAGVTTVKTAIEEMEPLGATNVPEGMAWGWRVISSMEPFTGGRPEVEKGNDKVVIVLTDGANTYYTPGSLGYSDPAGNKSIYSTDGYTGVTAPGSTTTRLYMNTTVTKSTFTNENYTKAMNESFATLCANAKAQDIIVMTVSLDLNSNDTTEKAQIDALKACSSDSRFRKDAAGKAEKLFWNATGGSLADDFKAIANELSNLRIVS